VIDFDTAVLPGKHGGGRKFYLRQLNVLLLLQLSFSRIRGLPGYEFCQCETPPDCNNLEIIRGSPRQLSAVGDHAG
jgi:hypothetical protein